jgi:hypothetical protein
MCKSRLDIHVDSNGIRVQYFRAPRYLKGIASECTMTRGNVYRWGNCGFQDIETSAALLFIVRRVMGSHCIKLSKHIYSTAIARATDYCQAGIKPAFDQGIFSDIVTAPRL